MLVFRIPAVQDAQCAWLLLMCAGTFSATCTLQVCPISAKTMTITFRAGVLFAEQGVMILGTKIV